MNCPECNKLFLQLGGIQSCIAEELDLKSTPKTEEDIRPIMRHLNLYKLAYIKAVEACAFMHNEPELGLTLGQEITSDGVKLLKAQRDKLRDEIAGLAKDKARLDWLGRRANSSADADVAKALSLDPSTKIPSVDFRAAIDVVIKLNP